MGLWLWEEIGVWWKGNDYGRMGNEGVCWEGKGGWYGVEVMLKWVVREKLNVWW